VRGQIMSFVSFTTMFVEQDVGIRRLTDGRSPQYG
jgi:hypothetical protein